MASMDKSESLGSGYYWVGSKSLADSLQCNPYLLVEGDEAVLFDPGSVLDVKEVVENIASILPLEKVKYVVLHHQDPDLASAVPHLEALGMKFTIAMHWRTWTIVRFYGITSPVYLVDEHGYSLSLATGRTLQFIGTPYLHFPGAITTYDKHAKFLLSSDLFGAFAPAWSLYAGPTYVEGMKTFHEHYMPSNEVLRPVMEMFSCLEIKAILPQHGSIIDKDVKFHIDTLMNLDCGTMNVHAKRTTGEKGNYREACQKVLLRVSAIHGDNLVSLLAEKLGITYDISSRKLMETPMADQELWNSLVEQIYIAKGHSGLTVLEPFINGLCMEYSLEKPFIYLSVLAEAQRNAEALDAEVSKLRKINEQLTQATGLAQDSLMKDAATGLYNETFFRNFIEEEAALMLNQEGAEDDVLAVLGIDEGMARIEYQYGPREVEAILKGVARIITDTRQVNQPAFRLHGATFALWLPRVLFHRASELCDMIRKKVEVSKAFIEPVTISIGLVALAEIKEGGEAGVEPGVALTDIGVRRLRLARKRGGNTICSSSEVGKDVEAKARVLIVDDDAVNADVIKTFLENADYSVTEAGDGDEALKKVGEEGFDMIISELMVPKIDGFMLKEKLSLRSGTKDIPFVLLSHLKDEKTVSRAYNLGIDHYLKKPFLLAELLGIVQNMASSGAGR